MTDCHSHLLPGVDDGVRTAEESLRILEEMEAAGAFVSYGSPPISWKIFPIPPML